MLKINDIVRSKRQSKNIIPYLIEEVINDEARCLNLLDKYTYTIPLDDLYLWVVK